MRRNNYITLQHDFWLNCHALVRIYIMKNWFLSHCLGLIFYLDYWNVNLSLWYAHNSCFVVVWHWSILPRDTALVLSNHKSRYKLSDPERYGRKITSIKHHHIIAIQHNKIPPDHGYIVYGIYLRECILAACYIIYIYICIYEWFFIQGEIHTKHRMMNELIKLQR